jgi:polar amino acid transport system substrate-binding protein
MAKCQYDAAISSITITNERKNVMDFSDPYIIAGQVVVVRKESTDIQGKDGLGGKQVGAEVNTTGAMEVSKIRDATLKTYPKIALAYQDLIDKRIDAVVADNPVALAYVGKNPDKLEIVGAVFTSEYYGIAVCKTNKELLSKVNAGLKACLNEKLVDKLIDKWLINQR